jgi:hypothetical protein
MQRLPSKKYAGILVFSEISFLKSFSFFARGFIIIEAIENGSKMVGINM